VLRLAGAAAAGAVAAAVTRSGNAAALNGDTMRVGFDHQATQQTRIIDGTAILR